MSTQDLHIFVAGGAGYIGSHTAKPLSRSGFVPVTFDNLSTGNAPALRFGPLVEGSIVDAAVLSAAVLQYNIQAVILFAGHAYVGESTGNPLKYYRNNIVASFEFLEALRQENVSRLVFIYSCSIFGQKDGHASRRRLPQGSPEPIR